MPGSRSLKLTVFLVALLAPAAGIELPAPADAQPELVIFQEGTTTYHWPGCAVIRDSKNVLVLSRGQAEVKGLKPHADCDPSKSTASGSTSGKPASSPVVTVYVEDPKYYHRKECPKLSEGSKSAKSIPLQRAAKSHWPCPTCRPPIYKKNSEPAVPGTTRRRAG